MVKIYRVFASEILFEKPCKSHVLGEKHQIFPPAAGTGRLKWVDDLSGENPTCFETAGGRLKWVDDLSVKPLYIYNAIFKPPSDACGFFGNQLRVLLILLLQSVNTSYRILLV